MGETLKEKIQKSMVAAMKGGDKLKLGVIRSIQAAIKQVEVDERITLDDEKVLSILDKMIRQRRESIKQFELGNRNDLIENETFQISIIQEFLPSPLTPTELNDLIKKAIQETGAQSVKDMGKVMALVKPQAQGRADIGEVGNLIKNQLTS